MPEYEQEMKMLGKKLLFLRHQIEACLHYIRCDKKLRSTAVCARRVFLHIFRPLLELTFSFATYDAFMMPPRIVPLHWPPFRTPPPTYQITITCPPYF